MRSGVPTTRASFCSAIASTAIRSRSPTSPVATTHVRGAAHHAGDIRVHGV
jgi:hypothetical protein